MITFKYRKKPPLSSAQKFSKHLNEIIEDAFRDRPHLQTYTVEELNRMTGTDWATTRLNRELLETYERIRRRNLNLI